MPRPPKDFGLVTDCQLRRWIFFLVVVLPRKKILLILSISLQTLGGSMEHCMTWVGMAVETVFMWVIWLARERELAFQFESFARSLSMRKAKALLFLLSMRIGTPRYFPKSLQELMFNSFSTAFIIFGNMCGEKYILDFEKFIFWSERE